MLHQMAKAYGQRPSAILRGSGQDYALDTAVWNVGVEIENRLNEAKDEGQRRAIMASLRAAAEGPTRTKAARERRRARRS